MAPPADGVAVTSAAATTSASAVGADRTVRDRESSACLAGCPAAARQAHASAGAIEDFLVACVARYARIAPADIDSRAAFASFGLGSREAVELSGELGEWLGREISPTLAWEHPSIEQMAEHLAADRGEDDAPPVATPPAS